MFQSIRWAFKWKEWNPSEKEFARAISCIQLEEKERLGRFVFRKDVRASLAGRLMMRKFVNEYGKVPYNEIKFTRDERNKPVLSTLSDVNFNVSHQGDYTVLAGELRNVKLGVDVMKLEYTGGKRLSEFFRIMNRNFTNSEWDEIKNPCLTESEQIEMFCRHWALKESYGKAIGEGITVGLDSLDFKTNSKLKLNSVTTDTILTVNGIKQEYLFEETLLDSEHCVAVALQKNGDLSDSENNLFEIINTDTLLANVVPLFPEDKAYTERYFEKQEHPF